MAKLFDLNIEQVLEHWGLEHALREIIANAIDEQILTGSRGIEIFEDLQGNWHIRDYGRGIADVHFTQNENKEKLESPNLIGKFGVGLKDALAVFSRHGIGVQVYSKFATVTLQMAEKPGFGIETLHAVFGDPVDNSMVGTEFIISGVSANDIEKAKAMFLRFSDAELLERTKYGEVYSADSECAYVYVNGVRVAQEENFMFSYNITNISAQIKKALNRERSNVGRTAYSDSVKKILISCKNESILLKLVYDLDNVMRGTNKDESSWIDVSTYAAITLDTIGGVVFLTPYERADLTNQQVEILTQSGKRVVLVSESLKWKLGSSVTTFSNVMQDYSESFEYQFVEYGELTTAEREVFDTLPVVTEFLTRHGYKTDVDVLISETIRVGMFDEPSLGALDGDRIIIARRVLTGNEFLTVVAHEFAHYISGEDDNSRAFENCLTDLLGKAMNEIGLAILSVGGALGQFASE